MPDIIDFDSEKDRRKDEAIEANGIYWENVRDQFALSMEASGLDRTSMVSAALSAIFEALDTDAYNNVNRSEAKAEIARALNAFDRW
jgi:hypothetical protein